MMDKQKQAYLLALTAVLMWSTVASAFKMTLRHVDVLQMLLYASLTAGCLLFVVLVLQRKLTLVVASTSRELLRSACLGFLNPFLYYIVLFKAYSILPAQEAQPLNYTWPVTLTLLSIPLLGQSISWKSLSAILISFIGVIVISTRGDILSFRLSDPLGVSLAVGSSVIWALFWIYNMRDARDAVLKLFLNFSFGCLCTAILILLVSDVVLPPVHGIAGSVYIGCFEMGITFVVWITALRLSVTTAKVSNLIFLSPFVSLVFIRYFVGEEIMLSTVIGLVFIVSGIIVQQRVE
jgi:drug/metabolite transporter (DMT)-like permease